jgi:hypothetical protein
MVIMDMEMLLDGIEAFNADLSSLTSAPSRYKQSLFFPRSPEQTDHYSDFLVSLEAEP